MNNPDFLYRTSSLRLRTDMVKKSYLTTMTNLAIKVSLDRVQPDLKFDHN